MVLPYDVLKPTVSCLYLDDNRAKRSDRGGSSSQRKDSSKGGCSCGCCVSIRGLNLWIYGENCKVRTPEVDFLGGDEALFLAGTSKNGATNKNRLRARKITAYHIIFSCP